jgi:Glycosyl hydrolase family 81 C-terminal domain
VNDLGPYLQKSLIGWLDARSGRTTQPTATGFAYDPNWNVMLPYPPGYQATPPAVDDGFFVVRLLNDMHFHYGYFIRAAAVYGQYNKSFIGKYGAMVEHLIRNLAAGYDDIPNSAKAPRISSARRSAATLWPTTLLAYKRSKAGTASPTWPFASVNPPPRHPVPRPAPAPAPQEPAASAYLESEQRPRRW